MQATKVEKPTTARPDPKPSSAAGRPVQITEDAVRERAREIYLARVADGRFGDELSDWLQAERDLKVRAAKSGSRTTH